VKVAFDRIEIVPPLRVDPADEYHFEVVVPL
jgi:hypothetical protein